MTKELLRLGKIKYDGLNVLNPLINKTEVLTSEQLNHHVHIVGASGFGKTVLISHILRHKIESGEGLVFIDLKNDQDTIDRLKGFVSKAKREKDFLEFSISNPLGSNSYNLLNNGDATELRDRIMVSLNWSEEFYKTQSMSFLLKVLLGFCRLRDLKGFSFGLHEILQGATDPEYLGKLFRELDDNSQDVRKLFRQAKDFLEQKDTFQSLQGLRAQLESLVHSGFGEKLRAESAGFSLSEHSQSARRDNPALIAPLPHHARSYPSPTPPQHIDLFDAYMNRKIVFITLDSRRYGESARGIGRFILQDLKSVSAKVDSTIPKKDRQPFTVVIDEFADLATEDFIGFLDRARSSRMSIVVAHQELCDLQRISEEFAGRLTGNMSTLYAFLQKNPNSAEQIASYAGTRLVQKKTYAYEKRFFVNMPTGSSSVRDVEEFIVHPNVIKKLGVGECVVIKKYPKSLAYCMKVAKPEN